MEERRDPKSLFTSRVRWGEQEWVRSVRPTTEAKLLIGSDLSWPQENHLQLFNSYPASKTVKIDPLLSTP